MGQHMILPKFPENCMKSKEFGCPGEGDASLHPLRSANALVFTKPLMANGHTGRARLIRSHLSAKGFCFELCGNSN